MDLNGGLEFLKSTREDQWLERLHKLDEQLPFDSSALKELHANLTKSAIDDFMKFDPIQAYLEDYNRMKRAFDLFAKEKKIQKWRVGTKTDEWMGP